MDTGTASAPCVSVSPPRYGVFDLVAVHPPVHSRLIDVPVDPPDRHHAGENSADALVATTVL